VHYGFTWEGVVELRGIPPNNYYGAVGPINRLLDAIGNNMSFADELNQIKKDRNQRINEEKEDAHQKAKEQFVAWVQQSIDSLESIKDRIRNDASQGKTKSVIISNVFKVAPPIFGRSTTKVFGGTPPSKGLVLGRDRQSSEYECARGSLLTSRHEPQGFNGKWYYIDETAGKSVILDEKLIELWELLESLGLRPFFSGGMDSASLCVHL